MSIFDQPSRFKTKHALLQTGLFSIFEQPRNNIDKSTGEITKGKSMEYMTFNGIITGYRDIIQDIRVRVYDNGAKRKPHRFLIEFSLNREVGQIKAGEFVDILQHNLWCDLDNDVTNFKEYRKAQKLDDDVHSEEMHDHIQDFFIEQANTINARELNRNSRLTGDIKRTTKIWYGLSKTATGKGVKRMDNTGALWMGDFADHYSGNLFIFIGLDCFTVRVERLSKSISFGDRKAISQGSLKHSC